MTEDFCDMASADLRERFEKAGQGHVFSHLETLSSEDAERLISELQVVLCSAFCLRFLI